MSKNNMYDNAVFNNSRIEPQATTSKKPILSAQPQASLKADGLFSLKNLNVSDRKPTTIILSKHNYILLKKLALDENLNMSEFVNLMLERLEAAG